MTPRSNSTYTVLVVDDDEGVRATYTRLLVRSGYVAREEGDPLQVLQAKNGAEGVDLLILDYKMPGMDGLTLLAELRKRECRVPCILISAYLNDAVRDRAKLLGVARILEKPVEVGSLRATLWELLPVDRPRRQAAGGGVATR